MIKSFSLNITIDRQLTYWLENVAQLFEVHSLSYEPVDKDEWPLETDSLPSSGRVKGSLFFQKAQNRDQMANFLKSQNFKYEVLDQEIAPWQEYHQKFMKPVTIGSLTIHPISPPEKLETHCLYFPAGLGFGTGHHETTQSCLELLQNQQLAQKNVLDFGSGSGILSVAALLLGAEKVFYLDIDPQAMSASKQNLKAHALEHKSEGLTRIEKSNSFDMILANILCEPILNNETLFARSLNQEGDLILSGILSEQSEQLEEVYSKRFRLNKKIKKNQWLGYHYIRK